MSAIGSENRSFQVLEAVSPLEGAPLTGRRRWSESFKATLVARTLEADVNVSAIARCAGVHPAQLFAWRRKALRQGTVHPLDGSRPHFVEVESVRSGAGIVEIVIGGIVVRAGAEIGEDHLRCVIRAVRD
jgi:transposase